MSGAIIGSQRGRAESAVMGGGDASDVVVSLEAMVFGCMMHCGDGSFSDHAWRPGMCATGVDGPCARSKLQAIAPCMQGSQSLGIFTSTSTSTSTSTRCFHSRYNLS